MPVRRLKETIENLSDRERLLAACLCAALCCTAAAVALALVHRRTSSLEATIEANAKVLRELAAKEGELREQYLKRQRADDRFEAEAPPLLGLLERFAGDAGIEIPESRDMPDETVEKKWVVKSSELKLRKVALETLVKFMSSIKNQNAAFPIAVTKLGVRERAGEPNAYDVQMTVATYAKKEKSKAKGKAATGAGAAGREAAAGGGAAEGAGGAAAPPGRKLFGPES